MSLLITLSTYVSKQAECIGQMQQHVAIYGGKDNDAVTRFKCIG